LYWLVVQPLIGGVIFNELFAYLHSWSATRRCVEIHGVSFFVDAYEKVARVWGEKHQKRNVVMDFCAIVGRNKK